MAIREIPLDSIDDNPHNPRKHYAPSKVKEMAISLQENGLRQVPEGREVDGRVQLAYGHMRLRGYRYNQKHQVPGSWASMPVDVKDISDRDMFHYAMEENLRRTDVTPLECARCIEAFSQTFPDILDEEIARRHGMTAANVSNMKRVLRLPEKFLAKIDEGKVSFTQGRELLILEDLPDTEELMSDALRGITGGGYYVKPNTVEGLQQSIHGVIKGKFPPLEKDWGSYRFDLLFDTRAAGCLECQKMVRTHPTKTGVAHFCTDQDCWEKHQQEHKDAAAAAARAKMEAEVLARAAREVALQAPESKPGVTKVDKDDSQYTLKKRGTSWIALDGQQRIIAIGYKKEDAETTAKASFEPVATILNPTSSDYVLNHTYRIIPRHGCAKHKLSTGEEIIDVTAQDLATAARAMLLKSHEIKEVKVYKSSGKIGTDGGVGAGWSKCTETLEDISQEKPGRVEKQAEEQLAGGDLPCETCSNEPTCGREYFHVSGDGDDRYICDERIPHEPEPPTDIVERARAAAGTRAQVLDLNDISSSNGYSRQMKSGFIILDNELRFIDDSQECLESCTHGFHYAFDSKAEESKEIHVCSDPKCLAQKKGTLTRKKNAEGLSRKNAERKAIQAAISGAEHHPRGMLILLIYAQVKGKHITDYFYGDKGKSPEKWLWDKVSAGTRETDRNLDKLMAKLDKLDEPELRQILLEMMFYYLQDHGDTSTYQIKTEIPLKWLGVDIQEYFAEKSEPAASVVGEEGES